MTATALALRGALGFLTRIPVGRDEAEWEAFAGAPWTLPVVGYLVGGLVALPLLAPVPAPTVALAFPLAVYAVTGITHLDGVADLGDAAVVHGGPDERREVMKDSALGVGGTVALVAVVLGLATAALGLAEAASAAGTPGVRDRLGTAVGVVVAAEVGAKAATATLVCVGDAAHEGLGSALTGEVDAGAALPVLALAAPAALLAWPRLLPGVAALLAALATAWLLRRWARRRLGGVSGDVLGATNELARVAALHAGVIAWTRF
ncbi:adenosylcobinamide-GDP ribazoletransferase [Halorubrum sp. CBA1229]|uniref:adenosylcobinamide-GDP ribazoletransferase n=1 Tax=Halorubrum sp. CBA1229 TaxID=1853699 RepID=UPI000F3FE97D|nr:adenosylcobinamide-GDP ribazoletransferase [Halorubrum sp. CBA1229]QKY16318.1 adenosylcobinamide-GDP ribazoletransferase [Halorubrum sp. CBA1229]